MKAVTIITAWFLLVTLFACLVLEAFAIISEQ